MSQRRWPSGSPAGGRYAPADRPAGEATLHDDEYEDAMQAAYEAYMEEQQEAAYQRHLEEQMEAAAVRYMAQQGRDLASTDPNGPGLT